MGSELILARLTTTARTRQMGPEFGNELNTRQSFQDDASREEGNVTGAVVIQPLRSRFSPEKLTGEEGKDGENDAFKKVCSALKVHLDP